jgi:hypothetical protein
MKRPSSIRPAPGVMLGRRGEGSPIGSLAQRGTVRLGRRNEKRPPRIHEFVPLARRSPSRGGTASICLAGSGTR